MSAATLAGPRPRIGVQGITFLGAGLLLLAVLGASAWSFTTPAVSEEYRLGPASAFAPGTVTSFVRTGDDLNPFLRSVPSTDWGWPASFAVPAGVSPHLGQTVLWFLEAVIEVGENRGHFGDDFSFWLVDGTRIVGPSPRDLPTYRHRIAADGALVIDLSEPVEGAWLPDLWRDGATREVPLPYDFLENDWPTSGWPMATN